METSNRDWEVTYYYKNDTNHFETIDVREYELGRTIRMIALKKSETVLVSISLKGRLLI